jgi:L-threonylcarbamoyladenylate synthase
MRAMITSQDTEILKVDPSSISFEGDKLTITDPQTEQALKRAAAILSTTSDVVAFPSETVYGLGGNSFDDEAVKNIYRAKNRPADNPLISHISSKEQVKKFFHVDLPDIYKNLVDAFWPGPLTILLPITKESQLSRYTTAGQDTFAVRLPSHAVARALIHLADVPVAAPSANASTRPSPTLAEHVYHDLQGKIPLILDGGSSKVGVESTVIDGLSDPPMLLRPGGISLEQIKAIGGEPWKNIRVAKRVADLDEPVKTPGMKYKHYSPTAKVVLVEQESNIEKYIKNHQLQTNQVALLTAEHFHGEGFPGLVKSMGVTKEEISSNLFKCLRDLDEKNVDVIFVEAVDETNEGLAIMNRLQKAASETI